MTKLTPRQRQFLRGLGHALQPVVQITEVSAGVVKETLTQLAHHELIKVKVSIDDRTERRAASRQLAEDTEAHTVQEVGKIVLLYRPNPDSPKPLRLPQ
jgi:RNA-binding protein